ncbi:N-acetyl-gamma-glutamyl-phosphate reductase [Roseivirga sp. BDSF3-8]|uniref:N-acetyl-gamma-glutamyl-phosphate reductase n=1 Tax=Roseivirga sp. BDSF3-8 TaxID=3241598 RepID=UPI00353274FD
MIRAGIIGGTGYTAGELIWLLLQHPAVKLQFVYSNSQSGKPVASVHPEFLGLTDMIFINEVEEVDILFLCLPHGKAKEFLKANALPDNTFVVDLSQDYRLGDTLEGRKFVYGLPELNREAIRKSKYVANPGCFATGIQLALLPLAKEGLLKEEEVHIHAITGATGAGAGLSATTHFSWRTNNLSVYKAFSHQHLAEIGQSMKQLDPDTEPQINFIPMRGDFARGIFASAYLNCGLNQEQARALYKAFYAETPFTLVSDTDVNLKAVVNTNRCYLQVQKHGNKLLVISAIDNLLKGASGQAVQNMNLMFGLEETDGLMMKPVKY